MTEGSAAVAVYAEQLAGGAGQSLATQPSAAQIERFRAEMDRPSGQTEAHFHYDAPLPQPADAYGAFKYAVDHAAEVSESFRTRLEQARTPIPEGVSPEVQVLAESMNNAVDMATATMSFTYLTKTVELTTSCAQTLYKQAG